MGKRAYILFGPYIYRVYICLYEPSEPYSAVKFFRVSAKNVRSYLFVQKWNLRKLKIEANWKLKEVREFSILDTSENYENISRMFVLIWKYHSSLENDGRMPSKRRATRVSLSFKYYIKSQS